MKAKKLQKERKKGKEKKNFEAFTDHLHKISLRQKQR
jgi:hypothetical protein